MTPTRWRTSAELDTLQQRAQMLHAIRTFFYARDVLEIETPLLAGHAVTDIHLDSMRLENGRFLNTSPEYCMKRFVAEHQRDAWQVCKCFRDGEAGRWHNPEFSMLEWYRIGFSLEQLMDETAKLVLELGELFGSRLSGVDQFSYAALFLSATDIDPHASDAAILAAWAQDNGIERPAGLGEEAGDGLAAELERDAWLDWLMSMHVTPALDSSRLTFIFDYPASQCALARLATDAEGRTVSRRFELYRGDCELANGYHELSDGREQAARFERDNNGRRLLGKPQIEADPLLLAALAEGLPDCSGVAVGLDRLLASLLAKASLEEVLGYPWTKV